MQILITGGCGFIGSHLAEYHLEKGDAVHVIDNLSTGTLKNIESFKNNSKFQFDEADMLTWPDLDLSIRSVDRIYHLAASMGMFKVIADPMSIVSNNMIACRRLLQTIADSYSRPIVIITSSSSVYGNSPKILLNENDDLIVKPSTHPLAPYAVSKICDEVMGLAYYQSKKIPVILPRIFNTIGPRQTGQYGMVVPRFVEQACNSIPFTIFGDGTQTRSFCDVRDVVLALDLLSQKSTAIGEIINVGNDREISINELAKLICQCTGKSNQSQYIPYSEAYGVDFTDITQRRPNIAKLMNLIRFKHQWTLTDTINNLISIHKKVEI